MSMLRTMKNGDHYDYDDYYEYYGSAYEYGYDDYSDYRYGYDCDYSL